MGTMLELKAQWIDYAELKGETVNGEIKQEKFQNAGKDMTHVCKTWRVEPR